MGLVLSDSEQSQLVLTARALLSPLDAPVGVWRASVLEHLTCLLDAPMAGFILPTGEPPHHTLHNLPESFAQEYFAATYAMDGGMAMLEEMGPSVWSTRLLLERAGLSADEGWFARPEYRQFYSRYGIQEGMGYVVPAAKPPLLEDGAAAAPPARAAGIGAVLTCFFGVFGTEACGGRGLAKLRLLLPALEAGVAVRVRLGWLRRTLHEALDSVQDGLELRDATGRVLHANSALGRILALDPERDRISAAIERCAAALYAVLRPGVNGAAAALPGASSEVRTARARYRVRGQFISGGAFGTDPAIILSVTRLTPLPPTLREMQDRWALTPQEARVALLLARGATNNGIAAELHLSPATARHYTEAVFLKLQVRSRAAATRRILAD
jgi:DNA-binding CsgD family transcriptional regulator/PAS domain-containing protein